MSSSAFFRQYVEDLPVKKSQVPLHDVVKEEDEFASDFEELEESIVDESNIEDDHIIRRQPADSKAQKFREKLEDQIGYKLFNNLYTHMKDLQQSGADEKTIKQRMKSRFGNSSLAHVFDIEQLLFMENN